jgi:hypothetical protein
LKKITRQRLGSAIQKQYLNRSLYLHRSLKLVDPLRIIADVRAIEDENIDWSNSDLGSSAEIIRKLSSAKIHISQAYCHPNIIQSDPRRILYYRNIVGLTQKALSKLAVPTREFENGQKGELSTLQAEKISVTVNNVATELIRNDPAFKEKDLLPNFIASLGVTLDGSWRNIVGEKATKEVKKLFLSYLKTGRLLKSSTRNTFNLKNQYAIKFASDPDVGIYSKEKSLIVAIEIKGGIDSAGALERYGAARKSFDKAKSLNIRCHTIYLASCITDAVKARINNDGLVSEIQDLLEVLSSPQKAKKFLDGLFIHIVRIKD